MSETDSGMNSSAVQKTKGFYNSCLDTKSIETAGADPFLSLIKKVWYSYSKHSKLFKSHLSLHRLSYVLIRLNYLNYHYEQYPIKFKKTNRNHYQFFNDPCWPTGGAVTTWITVITLVEVKKKNKQFSRIVSFVVLQDLKWLVNL